MTVERWEPTVAVSDEVVEAHAVRDLSALFDDGSHEPVTGDPLPPLWHWVALARWPSSPLLGADGHPRRGAFLPPVDLPRRMFAGGEVSFHAGLRVGSRIRRESMVTSVQEKSGRLGPLVVVGIETRLYNEGGVLAVEERQDLIYREASPTASRKTEIPQAVSPVTRPIQPGRRPGEWEFATDPSLLMRFSAVMSNPHRIHYDWPYATQVEGYPGLVVHGPLMTLALVEVLRLEQPTQNVVRLRHRNLKPLFCGQPTLLRRAHPEAEGDPVVTFGVYDAEADVTDHPKPHTTLAVELDAHSRHAHEGAESHAARSHL